MESWISEYIIICNIPTQNGFCILTGLIGSNRRPVRSMVVGRPILLALEDIDGSPSFLEKALTFIETYGTPFHFCVYIEYNPQLDRALILVPQNPFILC